MVISELVLKVKSELLDNAAFEAAQIVMHALGITSNDLILRAKDEVSAAEETAVYEMMQRRKNGEPLQYIIGTAEFMSLEFKVTKDTLIPRMDTETLVEKLLEIVDGRKIKLLDIGAGTGCIGISTAYYNKNTELTFVDISENALLIAKENAAQNNVTAKFLHMDILKTYPDDKFDVIVSNPPYIESDLIPTLQSEVKEYEPHSALDGGADGLLFYRRITDIAHKLLNENGMLFYEIGYNQGKAVAKLMEKDFKKVVVIKDLCGMDRVVYGTIAATSGT